jgi:thiamine-phosphate pyrophosphorylase
VFDVYLITPDWEPALILETARAALIGTPPGRVALQLRSKPLAGAERSALAHSLRALTREHETALLISADLDLAHAVGADGVQLPERGASVAEARARLGAQAWIGASRHDLPGVRAAEQDGASFITLSPVFAVPDKSEPLGLDGFAAIAHATRIPVFGLGGIGVARAADVVRSGARGVAVIREVWQSAQPARTLGDLLAAIAAAR